MNTAQPRVGVYLVHVDFASWERCPTGGRLLLVTQAGKGLCRDVLQR
jgi:hypothetical protein